MMTVLSATTNAFVKLSQSHVRAVAELIKKDKKYSASQLYNVARFELEGIQSSHVTTQFFAYNGFIDDLDKACVVAVQYRNFYAKQMFTMSAPLSDHITKNMATGLTQLVDWSAATLHAFMPKKFAIDSGLYGPLYGGRDHLDGKVLLCDEEIVQKLDIKLPEPWEFRKLDAKHAPQIAAAWRYTNVGAVRLLQDSMGCVDSAGIFKKDSEELVSSALFSNHGVGVALMTHPNYAGRGLGGWAALKNVQLTGQQGFMFLGTSEVDSFTVNIHKKSGLQLSDDMLVIFPQWKL